MSTKLQKCGRCKRHLKPGAFSPSKRGVNGKWCRACFRAYRQSKKSARNPSAAKSKARAVVKPADVVTHPKAVKKPKPQEVPALS